MEKNLGDRVKEQLLLLQIKSPCCKKSFTCGVTLFAKKRRNKFADAVDEYKEKLTHKKKKSFFDEAEGVGYYAEEQDGQSFPVGKRVCQYCHAALIRGAFLSCGRASESHDGIHLEMAVPNEKTAEKLMLMLSEVGIKPKYATRKGEILLYYKKRETVSDFIAYIGAVSLSFDMINESILKERRAVANRQMNCDTKNIMKSISAAERQVAAINAIDLRFSLDKLSPALQETAKLRKENPIASLDELTALHGGKVSRSGVNHRLAKLIEFAEKKGYILK